jgi:DNA-directed RNA polymerase subunit RPC12/RpoP
MREKSVNCPICRSKAFSLRGACVELVTGSFKCSSCGRALSRPAMHRLLFSVSTSALFFVGGVGLLKLFFGTAELTAVQVFVWFSVFGFLSTLPCVALFQLYSPLKPRFNKGL